MEYYTVAEVAAKLKLNTNTVYDYIKMGKMPASKLGNRYRVSEEQIKIFMDSMTIGHSKEEKK